MSTSINGFMSDAWRYTKAMPGFILGTEAELMGETLRNSYKTKGFKGFGKQIGDAFEVGVQSHEAAVTKNKGFFRNMWKDLTSIFPDIKQGWKSAGFIADSRNKSGWSKLCTQLGSVGKAFGKRMPLIGAVMTLAFELPNILKTTWNDGLIAGTLETGKTGVRLGCGAIGGAIGSALIPVPLLGSVVGYAIGDMVGRFVVGKSYTEKKDEQKEEIAQITKDTKIDFNMPEFSNDAEFQKLQQMYAQSAGLDSGFGLQAQQAGQNFSTLG